MRKALIAVIVATALFAVGAFAASFAVESEDIASGADDVNACATSVDIDFGTPVWDDTLVAPDSTTADPQTGDWKVAGATLRFYAPNPTTAALELTPNCQDFDITLRIEKSDGTSVTDDDEVVLPSDGTASVTFTSPIQVSLIERASLLLDGEEFTLAAS